MPEITATQFMTDNLSLWLEGHSITDVIITDAANQSRIALNTFPLPSPICRQVWRRGKHSVVPIGDGALVFATTSRARCSASTPESELKGQHGHASLLSSQMGAMSFGRTALTSESAGFPKRGPEDTLIHQFFEQDHDLALSFGRCTETAHGGRLWLDKASSACWGCS